MTITTVGYDLNPKTLLGKLIGGCCALSGVFILTLPIPIVVNSFAVFYKNRLWRNEVEHKKRERMLQLTADKRAEQRASLIQVTLSDTKEEQNFPRAWQRFFPQPMWLAGTHGPKSRCIRRWSHFPRLEVEHQEARPTDRRRRLRCTG